MQKIYASFLLGLVFLLGGLNFGLYKPKIRKQSQWQSQLQ